jgi:nucleotide-binding universal stress UspA family protein
MATIRRLLVAIDLSDISTTILDHAQSLAQAWGAHVVVVHVVQDLSAYMGMALDIVPLAEWLPRRELAARDQLQALCNAVFDSPLAYDAVVLTGHPVAEIHREIQERGVDCLVIGAHGDDRAEHRLFGSTAERLLHLMPCLTVIVPPSCVGKAAPSGNVITGSP